VTCQFLGLCRRAGTRQVFGGGDDDAAVFRQPDGDQARIGQVAKPDRAVEAFVDQIDNAVGEIERECDVRMRFDEQGHQRCHVLAAEAGRRGDAQVAAGLDAAGGDAGFGVVRSLRMRWQSSRNAEPSKVRVILRVVRTSNFTPSRSSSASMRRPMIAGATPSAAAAADRLPRDATDTKVSNCLN
jgi:hypothetical protein